MIRGTFYRQLLLTQIFCVGETVKVTKEVAADSKEAKQFLEKEAATEEEASREAATKRKVGGEVNLFIYLSAHLLFIFLSTKLYVCIIFILIYLSINLSKIFMFRTSI